MNQALPSESYIARLDYVTQFMAMSQVKIFQK